MHTVSGLGNRKDGLQLDMLRDKGVEVYPRAVALVRALNSQAVPCAVASASENTQTVLDVAGIAELF